MTIALPERTESREKALRSLRSRAFLTVWEGAVRSSKTVLALAAFCLYVVRSPEKTFLLSGRTLATVERNCVLGEMGILAMLPGAVYGRSGESRAVLVRTPTATKTVVVMGASDIRAYMALRGSTFGGWMADEANMHDPEFVSEALRRTAVSTDRRHLWTLNPDNPRHWIYTDYLDRYAAMDADEMARLGGYEWYHFVPEDNPAMTPAMLDSLKAQYPRGYLYDRYVLGLRRIAEGLVYLRDVSDRFRDGLREGVDVRWCSVDFGADHPTVMYWAGTYRGNRHDWRVVREYYDKGSDRTVGDHYREYLKICGELSVDPGRVTVVMDPSAKALRLEFASHGLKVQKARNDVLPGIDYTRRVVYDGVLTFDSSCVHAREEFATYSWDPRAAERGEDKVVKKDDDCMDSIRYLAYTVIRQIRGRR